MEFVTRQEIRDEDVMLIFIMRNPVLLYEFLDFMDKFEESEDVKDNEVFQHFWYQKDILCDFNPYVSVRASRSCGKTVTLRSKIVWLLLNNAYGKESILLTTPNKVHLKPVWSELTKTFRMNVFASKFLKGNRGINSQDFEINLLNHASLVCRIAGVEGGERNAVAIHVPFIAIDEAGLYPWDTYQALQPVLNRHQRGHQLILVGVPTGEKDRNVLWEADVKSEIFSKHRINAFMNPLYTDRDHEDDIRKYGGKDSPDYIHYVLGEHGTSSFSLFSRDEMVISNYPVYKLTINFRTGKETEETAISKIRSFINVEDKVKRVFAGVDLGYTDPTAIYIIKEVQSKYYIHGRIKLIRVPYPVQRRILEELDRKFNFEWVAVDVGSAGRQFYQEFLDEGSSLALIPVNFSQSIVIGTDDEGKDIKQNVKEISVNHLQKLVIDGDIVFSTTDPDTISDLERLSYSRTPAGKITYYLSGQSRYKQDDHFLAALLCFAYGDFSKQFNQNVGRRTKSIRQLVGARML